MASQSSQVPGEQVPVKDSRATPGLKKIPPYWYPYTTMAKGRWLGREVLEVVSTEFRDRSMEFYRYALESGVTTINGKVAKPDTIIQNGDRLENVSHRHEPPVTSTPVRIVLHDKERQFIVIDKPGSIPVHAAGRYFRNSLVEILKNDFGFEKVYTVNRLDRLTSGLMILPLNPALATTLSREFVNGEVKKEYVARCKGKFPEEEIVCEEPLLTVDRQMGLNIVHPEGKPAKTIFKRIRYDANTDTSVLQCRPQTGRSHQIRVHLQYLGYPIANDPIYSDPRIWGENLGKGGIDLVPSDERAAPQAPAHSGFQFDASTNPESINRTTSATENDKDDEAARPKLLPRETGHDIGMGSPVPLSAEAVGIITRLRNMKDEAEDWGRWRDVVFRAKAALAPHGVTIPLPPQNRRKRGGPALASMTPQSDTAGTPTAEVEPVAEDADAPPANQITVEDVAQLAARMSVETSASASVPASEVPTPDPTPPPVVESSATVDPVADADGMLYCPECFVPLHPDPKPESLYIFLHALKYTTSLGTFETQMPEWAAEGWEWER
ncbi:pseudouridine synthase [Lentinus tigrinus ALCF2SS1-7]|uniref:Pseudouridine synthase n=1 Tax=Lentinus tigrinus ALCF2SS1-6 TaxID=1328759 RepID=A0A5C2S9E8_9APHY|nr:pseudouridine synthase [Lentinus tigrinus ALCF2SS1-6]RPD70436.1 pseudouridine synthase [Lentinus tigrinus ALCF2SS1-7]